MEVDNFLNNVAEEMERLEEDKAGLEAQLELERSTKSQLEELLGAARQLQTSILDKAKEDARIVMNQAELVADRLTSEARENAQRIRNDIQLLKDRKAAVLAELSGLSHSLGQWVERIDEKTTDSSEIPEVEAFNGAPEATPLIRLAPEVDDEAEDLTEEELEAETFDLDSDAAEEPSQGDLSERELEADGEEEY